MSSATFAGPLDRMRVASPCRVVWESMTGDDRVRRCAVCELNVYNVSAMTPPEAQQLMETHEGRLCVMYHSRPDGTIITRDCPVGADAIRRRLGRTCLRSCWRRRALLEGMTRRRVSEHLSARPVASMITGAMVAVVAMGMAAFPLVWCSWSPDSITFAACTFVAGWLVLSISIRSPRPGCCLHCGYDVIHITERVRCTECGTPFASFAPSTNGAGRRIAPTDVEAVVALRPAAE